MLLDFVLPRAAAGGGWSGWWRRAARGSRAHTGGCGACRSCCLGSTSADPRPGCVGGGPLHADDGGGDDEWRSPWEQESTAWRPPRSRRASHPSAGGRAKRGEEDQAPHRPGARRRHRAARRRDEGGALAGEEGTWAGSTTPRGGPGAPLLTSPRRADALHEIAATGAPWRRATPRLARVPWTSSGRMRCALAREDAAAAVLGGLLASTGPRWASHGLATLRGGRAGRRPVGGRRRGCDRGGARALHLAVLPWARRDPRAAPRRRGGGSTPPRRRRGSPPPRC